MTNSAKPEIKPGSGRYTYIDPEENTGAAIRIWYHRPADYTAASPVVLVMHGMGRNADGYRDNWVSSADAHGFLVITPEFDMDQFPDDWPYSLGNLAHDEDGAIVLNPKEKWSLPVIDRIFAQVRDLTGTARKTFSLFGHSAGGQFVHRYMTFADSGLVDVAVAANPGFYTLPVQEEAFPYGLGGVDSLETALADYYARPVVILLGEADTLQTPNLRQTPEAMRQGPHRFARGQNYFATAQREADRLGVPFNWRLETVPNVGHSNGELAEPAGAIIAEMAP